MASVEHKHRCILQYLRLGRIAAATDSNTCGKHIIMTDHGIPYAIAAHRNACCIYPVFIYAIGLLDLIHQIHNSHHFIGFLDLIDAVFTLDPIYIHPAVIMGALGDQNNGFGHIVCDLLDAVIQLAAIIHAPFACAMEKYHHWKYISLVIDLRQHQTVRQGQAGFLMVIVFVDGIIHIQCADRQTQAAQHQHYKRQTKDLFHNRYSIFVILFWGITQHPGIALPAHPGQLPALRASCWYPHRHR